MIVVEYETEDYGKIMKYVTCIEEKAAELKELLTESSMDHRGGRKDYSRDDEEFYGYRMPRSRYK